jgi:tRNA-dihydrouridine synthase A
MIGRESYHDPWCMADWDARFLGGPAAPRTRESVEAQMVEYLERLQASEHHWSQASRHMLGLWNGVKGARRWRQVWSDHTMKTLAPTQVSRLAHAGAPVSILSA